MCHPVEDLQVTRGGLRLQDPSSLEGLGAPTEQSGQLL